MFLDRDAKLQRHFVPKCISKMLNLVGCHVKPKDLVCRFSKKNKKTISLNHLPDVEKRHDQADDMNDKGLDTWFTQQLEIPLRGMYLSQHVQFVMLVTSVLTNFMCFLHSFKVHETGMSPIDVHKV